MMIKDERQYRITKAQVATFEMAFIAVSDQPLREATDPVLAQAQTSAVRSQRDDLLRELAEFDTHGFNNVTHL